MLVDSSFELMHGDLSAVNYPSQVSIKNVSIVEMTTALCNCNGCDTSTTKLSAMHKSNSTADIFLMSPPLSPGQVGPSHDSNRQMNTRALSAEPALELTPIASPASPTAITASPINTSPSQTTQPLQYTFPTTHYSTTYPQPLHNQVSNIYQRPLVSPPSTPTLASGQQSTAQPLRRSLSLAGHSQPTHRQPLDPYRRAPRALTPNPQPSHHRLHHQSQSHRQLYSPMAAGFVRGLGQTAQRQRHRSGSSGVEGILEKGVVASRVPSPVREQEEVKGHGVESGSEGIGPRRRSSCSPRMVERGLAGRLGESRELVARMFDGPA